MMCQKLKDDLKHKYGESCVFYPEIAMTCDTQEEILEYVKPLLAEKGYELQIKIT